MKKVDVPDGPGPRIDLRLTKVRFYHFEYFFFDAVLHDVITNRNTVFISKKANNLFKV